jgi:tRNA(adenine34) deaminase
MTGGDNAAGNFDLIMMRRCVALAKSSASEGEYPFAAVIAKAGVFICESANRAKRDGNVNGHAEIIAVAQAQCIERRSLSDCTIYTTVEPCALCAYAIREAGIGRVVYGLRSPLMGGHSRWNILSDDGLSRILPEVFMPAPVILSGILQDEIEAVFKAWNPLFWQVMRMRGVFLRCEREAGTAVVQKPGGFTRWLKTSIRAFVVDRIRKI